MTKELRILLLEDRETDAELVLRELRKGGIAFSALRVETESEYRRQLQEFAPDLILADYTLPSYDGLSALAVAERECPDLPFIFVSGQLGEETAIDALQHGATDYVLKQRLGRLGPAVQRALREREEQQKRKQAEVALRESEMRYRALTQSANDAIVTADGAGTIVGWNQGARTIFGYSEAEALGQPLILLIPPRFRDQHLDGLKQVEAGGESRVIGKTVELVGLRQNGSEFPMEMSLAKWEVSTGSFYTGIMRDITERQRAVQALRESEQHLRLLYERGSKSTFGRAGGLPGPRKD